jgi:hypothetical protein
MQMGPRRRPGRSDKSLSSPQYGAARIILTDWAVTMN